MTDQNMTVLCNELRLALQHQREVNEGLVEACNFTLGHINFVESRVELIARLRAALAAAKEVK